MEAHNGSTVGFEPDRVLSGGELLFTGSGVLTSTSGSFPPTLSDLTVNGWWRRWEEPPCGSVERWSTTASSRLQVRFGPPAHWCSKAPES